MGRPRGKTVWSKQLDNTFIACLKHGETCISQESYNLVKDYKWFTKKAKTGKYYVYSHFKNDKKILLSRLILNAKKGELVDHINGNTLDNRLVNLRIVNRLQNNVNSKKRKNCKSKYKGLTLRPSGNWGVYICKDGINYCLGTYKNEKQAALVYNKKALELFGKYAKLNEIKE